MEYVVGLKIYIAAPWIEKDRMPAIAKLFEDFGVDITHKWWEVEDDGPEADRSPNELRRQGALDLNGVLNADAVVLINSSKSEGKAVEQGIALAQDKTIVAVGQLGKHSNNVFHYLGNYVWVDTVDDAVNVILDVDGRTP